MMPNPSQGPGVQVGPGPQAAPPPGAGAAGGPSPEEVKGQLMKLLTQAKQIADQNGVDWNSLVSEITDSKVKSDRPLPRPPGAGGPPMP